MFKLSEDNSNIIAHILVRNGCNKEAKLEKIAITIMDDSGNVIARSVFKNSDGIIRVSSHKVKLVKLTIESSNISTNDYDLSKCTGLFK